jgi:hypothetical protein
VATHAGTNANPQGGGGSDSGGGGSYSGGDSSGGAPDLEFLADPKAILDFADRMGAILPPVKDWSLSVGELAEYAPLTDPGQGDETWNKFAEQGYFKNVANIQQLALAVYLGIIGLQSGLKATGTAFQTTEDELTAVTSKLGAGFDAQSGQIPGSTKLPSSGNEAPSKPGDGYDSGYGSGGDTPGGHTRR